MNVEPNLRKYEVYPAVVEADKETSITIKCLDGIMKFYDDITYKIRFISMDCQDILPEESDISGLRYQNVVKTYEVKPENGIIKLSYFFKGEQEWKIHISTDEYDKHMKKIAKDSAPFWDWIIRYPQNGIYLKVYSLYSDLYERRALRGDLHIHSERSDGHEGPKMLAAGYRQKGYDFIAITDHAKYASSKEAEEAFDFATDFKIMVGEEIHNGYGGGAFVHMVAIGTDCWISQKLIENYDEVKKEIIEFEKETAIPDGVEKYLYLTYKWVYNEVKKANGYAIFPHPYWIFPERYHCDTKFAEAVIKGGLCDAFELLGGIHQPGNNLQVALYNNLRAEGYNIPIVGSTDAHSVFNEGGAQIKASTVAFVKDNDIIRAISDGYSVAVEHIMGETPRIYGDFRMVKYAWFLWENYFPVHSELCSASGTTILGYINGESKVKSVVEALEKRIKNYEKKFFGR